MIQMQLTEFFSLFCRKLIRFCCWPYKVSLMFDLECFFSFFFEEKKTRWVRECREKKKKTCIRWQLSLFENSLVVLLFFLRFVFFFYVCFSFRHEERGTMCSVAKFWTREPKHWNIQKKKNIKYKMPMTTINHEKKIEKFIFVGIKRSK